MANSKKHLHPRRFGNAIVAAIVGSMLACMFAGCGADNALEERMKEFRYTPERLTREVTLRLEQVAETRRRSERTDAATEAIQSLEAERGTDGGRPDPNSMEAIVSDVVTKFASMEAFDDTTLESNTAARQTFFDSIEASEDIDEKVKSTFLEKLKADLPPVVKPEP